MLRYAAAQLYQTIHVFVVQQPHTFAHKMLVSLTVGKVDAGVAVLLTEDKRLVSPSMPRSAQPSASASLQFTLADVELD
jgi:hypothetical protein